MHEAERDEFGEATSFRLQVAEKQHLPHPVGRSLRMAIHERRGGANAAAVRRTDDFDPLRCRKLVGREDVSNLIVQNFGGSSGQCAETIVAQHRQIVGERHARQFDAIHNFHRGKGMNVHPGSDLFHGAQNVAVIKLREVAREPALDAHLGRAQLPGFHRFLPDLFRTKEVSIGLARPAAEGAELASDETNVGEIDVAVDHVSDDVPGKLGAEHVRGHQQTEQVVPFRIRERVRLLERQLGPILGFENLLQRRPHRWSQTGSNLEPVEREEVLEFRGSQFASHDPPRREACYVSAASGTTSQGISVQCSGI